MYKRGLVIGKFYPPHRGHKFLIDAAIGACEKVTVIVCWKESEIIAGPLRAEWIRKIHPDVEVKVVVDDHLADDDSEGWAKETIELLGYVPDAVFTSEAYGDPYAAYMGSVHVLVDKERVNVPVSGTLVRSDPKAQAHFLDPVVRAYFTKRIRILGAESTGTTTLSRDLAAHYTTAWVPEYGRFYSEGKLASGEGAVWRSAEFVAIAEGQCALEDSLAESANHFLICDTDAFATSLWHERYMGIRSKAVEEIARNRTYDLTILTGDEIPFEQDGLRDGEHIRHDMHKRFIERLEEEKIPYLLVTGSKEERFERVIAAIDAL